MTPWAAGAHGRLEDGAAHPHPHRALMLRGLVLTVVALMAVSFATFESRVDGSAVAATPDAAAAASAAETADDQQHPVEHVADGAKRHRGGGGAPKRRWRKKRKEDDGGDEESDDDFGYGSSEGRSGAAAGGGGGSRHGSAGHGAGSPGGSSGGDSDPGDGSSRGEPPNSGDGAPAAQKKPARAKKGKRLPVYPSGTWREWAAADLAPVLRAASAAAGDAADPQPPPGVPWDADASFRWLASLRCTPAFVGTECPPGDVLTNTSALQLLLPEAYGVSDPDSLPGAVALRGYLHNTGCATWRRGVFTRCGRINDLQWAPATQAELWPHTRWFQPALPPLPASHPAAGAGLPLCKPRQLTKLSDGEIDEDTRLWTPRRCRLPYRFPHDLLHSCLRGKRLMLVGDSPLRQLAVRLAALIRGQPQVMEHEFGPAATYSWDGARDEWRVHPGTDYRDTDTVNVTGMRRGTDLPDDPDAFYMLRHFQSKLHYPRTLRAMMAAFQPTDLVVGTNYWIRSAKHSAEAPQRIADMLLELLAEHRRATSRSLKALYWYEFPCHAKPGRGFPPPYKLHERRNEAMTALLRSKWADPPAGSAGDALQHVALGFLPTCATARAGVSAFSTDTVHLACRYDPAPRPDGTAYPQTGMKNTVDNDCSMGVELTNIRVLLAGMCPDLFQ